ncbi:MAG: hypothetical protein NWT12_15725 [Paracoccaceae bacterium]|nr:hypothetical protein [Paracoccaceae bacterium]MDP5367734.1 hypothetical protein [Paracoccaceae bacterium]
MQHEVLATVSATGARRVMAITVLVALGGVLVYFALAQPPQALAWQVIMLGLGVLVLLLAERMRRAEITVLELTREGLREKGGQMLVRMDQIASVNRGVFAFKPSNGFVILTHAPHPLHWNPGLWWRVGRRIGVGGVAPAVQAKYMADVMQAILTEGADSQA